MICLHYLCTSSKPQRGSPYPKLLLAPLLIECLHIGLRERRQYQLEFMVIPLWVSMIDFFTSSRPNKSFNRFQNKIISKVDLWHCTFIIIFSNTLFYFTTANIVLYPDIVAEIVNKISPTAHFLHLGKWDRHYIHFKHQTCTLNFVSLRLTCK